MSYVIAIDVGIKNLGLCIFDFRVAKVVVWDNVSLTPNGRYIPAHNVQYVRTFVDKYKDYFIDASNVIIERQMRCNMRIIEAVLQCMFFERCIIVAPKSIKAHYNIGTRNYRANKQKAVQWAKQFAAVNPQAFWDNSQLVRFRDTNKQDDFADSLLLVMYFLDTYSNQLSAPFADVIL